MCDCVHIFAGKGKRRNDINGGQRIAMLNRQNKSNAHGQHIFSYAAPQLQYAVLYFLGDTIVHFSWQKENCTDEIYQYSLYFVIQLCKLRLQ